MTPLEGLTARRFASKDALIPYRDPAVPLSPGQAELRRIVLKEVTANPETFSMQSWELRGTRCGTTRCIAGWSEYYGLGAVPLGGIFPASHLENGIRLPGLTRDEFVGRSGTWLFYTSNENAIDRLREMIPEGPQDAR